MSTNNSWNTSTTYLTVAEGGTGNTTLTANAVLLGNGSSATADTGAGSAGQILLATGASSNPAWVTPTAGTGVAVTTNATTLNYGLSTPVSVANSGTGASSFTAYAPVCAGTTTTGAFQSVSGLGLSGQVLCSQGSSALPIWQGAAFVKIATNTPSNAATSEFTSGIGSTYKHYLVTFSGIQPVTTLKQFRCRVGTSGPSYVTSGYLSGAINHAYNTTTLAELDNTAQIALGPAEPTSSSYMAGYIYFLNLSGASGTTTAFYCSYTGSTDYQTYGSSSISANTFVAIEFYFGTGNINLGTLTLYGIVS